VNKSESIKNLAKALADFQGEVQNPKNTADNPFFKSKYAPLQDILTLVRPIMAKHGLSILQSPSGDGKTITISTVLMHSSGEWIEPDPLVLQAEKATAQGAGSAITYGRRYALSAILGISSEDDDDGNQATKNGNGQAKPFKPPTKETPKPKLNTKAKYTCSTCNKTITEKVYKFSTDKLGKALCMDCQKKPQDNGIKWSSFWAQAKNLGYDNETVHNVAGHYFNKEISSLKDVIKTQQDLDSFLDYLEDILTQ